MAEHANVVGQNRPPADAPYVNTYNSNWRNHPNLAWKPKPPPYVPPHAQPQYGSSTQPQPPQSTSPVEQAIMNLSKVVGDFFGEHKLVNDHVNKKIEAVETLLNIKLDNIRFELQSSISRLSNQQQGPEKGKFPSQT